MAKIICVTTGLTGILNSSLELVSRLKAEGHEVEYAAPRSIGERLKAERIAFTQLPEILNDPSPIVPEFKGAFKKFSRWIYKIKNKEQRIAEALKNTRPNEFEKMLEKKSPDLILIDIELHEYIFKAHQMQQRFVLLSQWFSLWRIKGLPYLLRDTIPGKGLKGSSLAIEWDWTKVNMKRTWTFIKKKVLSGGTDRRSTLKRLAKELSFPLDLIKENYWPGPFTYNDLPVWSMTALEMEFPHEPRPKLTYIGPMVFEKRKERNSLSNCNSSVEEILEYKNKIDGQLIYCNLSTLSKGDFSFLKKMIQVMKKRKKWVMIIAAGALAKNELFKSVPENVFLFEYVAQLKVLQKADLSINHGGIHTINECIHYEVPMLVYSGKKSDQNGCAARVDYHGLGVMRDKDKDGVMEMEESISRVLKDNSFKENLRRMNEKMERYRKIDYKGL